MNLEEAMRERITELEADLATERAAREQAEAELRSRLSDAKFHRHQALRERDTALARVEELETERAARKESKP